METPEKISMTLVRQRFLRYDSKNMNQKKEKKPKKTKKHHRLDLVKTENFCSSLLFYRKSALQTRAYIPAGERRAFDDGDPERWVFR